MVQSAAHGAADPNAIGGLDTAMADPTQARPAWDMGVAQKGRLRVRTLTASR